jgi:hypothetical protein
MPKSTGLNHVAMSVPRGTLSDENRARLAEFYGEHLGWREIDDLRLPDRLTFAVGGRTYVNIRERDDAMVCHGYEHFGLTLSTVDDVESLWADLEGDDRVDELAPMERGDDGYRVFRFRYLLPMLVEVQHLP